MESSAGKNGRVKLATASSVVAIMLAGLTGWQFYQEHQENQVTEQRNERQMEICTSVNRLVRVLDVILREATLPRAEDSEQRAASRREFKQFALDQIADAKCTVTPVERPLL